MYFRRPLILLVAVTAVGGLAAGCAPDPNDAPNAVPTFEDGNRVIEVSMIDLAFSPSSVEVTAGQTVHFWFRNDGAAIHDAAIGDLAFQQEHAREMAAGTADHGTEMAAGTADHGTEVDALVLAPGESGDLTYTATTTGTVLIGCHQPGHWEAGMKASINII
jgi:uncharacterized cupredoxin-like copper-binding protein